MVWHFELEKVRPLFQLEPHTNTQTPKDCQITVYVEHSPVSPNLLLLSQKQNNMHTLPPSALPSLFMEISAMAPNHGAPVPYESISGARWPGLRSMGLVPLSEVPKRHQTKNREMGGALALVGCHLMKYYNNQSNNSVVRGGVGVGEQRWPGWNMWGGRVTIIWRVKLSNRKIKLARGADPSL